MDNLAEVGLRIVNDHLLAPDDRAKLLLIRAELGFDQSTAQVALAVLRQMSQVIDKLKQSMPQR